MSGDNPGLPLATRNRFYDDLPEDVRSRIELLAHAACLHEALALTYVRPSQWRGRGIDRRTMTWIMNELARGLELHGPARTTWPTERKMAFLNCKRTLVDRVCHARCDRSQAWLETDLQRVRRLGALDLSTRFEDAFALARHCRDEGDGEEGFSVREEHKMRLHYRMQGRRCALGAARAAQAAQRSRDPEGSSDPPPEAHIDMSNCPEMLVLSRVCPHMRALSKIFG